MKRHTGVVVLGPCEVAALVAPIRPVAAAKLDARRVATALIVADRCGKVDEQHVCNVRPAEVVALQPRRAGPTVGVELQQGNHFGLVRVVRVYKPKRRSL